MGEIEFGGIDDPSVCTIAEPCASADGGVLEVAATDKDKLCHLIGVDGIDVEGDQAFCRFHYEIRTIAGRLLEGFVGGEDESLWWCFVGLLGL